MTYVSLLLLFVSFAHAVEFKISSNVGAKEKQAINEALDSVMSKVPAKFRDGLPKTINIKVSNLEGKAMPDICSITDEKDPRLNFKYGQYRQIDSSLTLNSAVVAELVRGERASLKTTCQHKSLYAQAVATIIHEITHAYDMNSGKPSQTPLYRNAAGFKKFLVFETKRNKDAMRSMDEYEFKNASESFAVNMEYFMMDEEFRCRKPVIFRYFKKLFGEDPFPGRKCDVNPSIMVATQMGLMPFKMELSRVYRVDYLLAASGSDAAASFGHSMFRIVVCAPEHTNTLTGKKVPATPFGPKCLEDKIFHIIGSFRANNEGSTLNYLKGIFGGYPSMLFMLPFSEVIEQYNNAEMRDLVSYPLILSAQEKRDFLERLVEEHWNYRGDYKFATNNCATETMTTLKSITLDREGIKGGAYTPNGVLKFLVKNGIVNANDPGIETFKASSKGLAKAYTLAYGKAIEEKGIAKHIFNSKIEDRMAKFNAVSNEKITGASLQEKLKNQKTHLARIASFSVIEQQVVRSKTDLLKKKLAEFSSKKENQKKYPEIFKAFGEAKPANTDIGKILTSGYGIPQDSEIKIEVSVNNINEDSKKIYEIAEKILNEIFPDEVRELQDIAHNLQTINELGVKLRKDFRQNLEGYIEASIVKLASENSSIITNGDVRALREKLGKEILTVSEISDLKLKKLMEQAL